MGSKKALRLLQRAKDSPYGWTRNELDSLYKNFGFIIVSRTKHDIAKHPDLPQTEKATLTRSSGEIHPDYIRRAVELIDMLLEKKESNMDKELLEQAKKLASRNYTLSVYEDRLSNGTVIYMAKNPELNGCMAQGVTIEEAIENLLAARTDYIYDALEDGVGVPDPADLAVKTAFTLDTDITVITQSVDFEKTLEDVSQPSHRKQLYEAWIRT